MKYALLAVGTFAVTAGAVRLSMGTSGSLSTAVLAIVLGAMCAAGLFVLEALNDTRHQQPLTVHGGRKQTQFEDKGSMTNDKPIDPTRDGLAAAMPVKLAAGAFIDLIWGRHDFRGAWQLVDPAWRRCWAQTWLYSIRDTAARDGWNVDEVVEAFAADHPGSHQLWSHFERTQLRGLLGRGDLTQWTPVAAPRLITPGIETVTFFPPGITTGRAGETQQVQHVMMRHDHAAGWRVLNLKSETVIPRPGWPPHIS